MRQQFYCLLKSDHKNAQSPYKLKIKNKRRKGLKIKRLAPVQFFIEINNSRSCEPREKIFLPFGAKVNPSALNKSRESKRPNNKHTATQSTIKVMSEAILHDTRTAGTLNSPRAISIWRRDWNFGSTHSAPSERAAAAAAHRLADFPENKNESHIYRCGLR